MNYFVLYVKTAVSKLYPQYESDYWTAVIQADNVFRTTVLHILVDGWMGGWIDMTITMLK